MTVHFDALTERCDAECPAAGQVEYLNTVGTVQDEIKVLSIILCKHHSDKHNAKLRDEGWMIERDNRPNLVENRLVGDAHA